jgi:cytochrome c553
MHAAVTRPEVDRPQAMRDISTYVAGLPGDPDPERGDGTRLPAGERLYAQSCMTCHGKNGEGSQEDLIPAIGGQQYRYLLVRLRSFAQQHDRQELGSMEPAVINLLARLSPDEMTAVADYTSRLPSLRGK